VLRLLSSIVRTVLSMSKVERIALVICSIVVLGSGVMLFLDFYKENTIVSPKDGGTYIEASVGELEPLNPWLSTGNNVTHDIASLIFAGLMKYDPVSGTVINDLATVSISNDQKTYTATLKDNLFWHDSTVQNPHPVTADDVLFTFQSIQTQGFPNPILVQNFRGVTIEKINAKTVRFTLEKPYAFFSSNLTLGLVPKQALSGANITDLSIMTDFGFQPIGAGPYSFMSLLQTDISSEVTLRRFERSGFPSPHIERMIFRIFPEYNSLLTDIMNVNGVRTVPRNEKGLPLLPKYFTPLTYTLPQYVALFFNMDRQIPSDKLVRLGLQLGTNKQKIVDEIHETKIIDSPLLEMNSGDWRYNFDQKAAQGAFFESNWNMPEKIRLQTLLEKREANRVGPLSNVQSLVYLGSGALLTLTGSTKNLSMPTFVNGQKIETGATLQGKTLSGTWLVRLQAGSGMSGSIKTGMNIIKMTDGKGDIIDSAFLERITDQSLFRRSMEEKKLVDEFLLSKKKDEKDPSRITIADLSLENGYLRRIQPSDPPHTRVNANGKELTLTLLTSPRPAHYQTIARNIQKQWRALGAKVTIDTPDTMKEFEEKLLTRSYDVVLFGQSLLDNLDSYPYFHSSQIQERNTADRTKLKLDALNLSQYASFEADALLTKIRETSDEKRRKAAIQELNALFKKDMPCMTLYSPLSVYGLTEDIHNVSLHHMSLHADRFGDIDQWYINTKRVFQEGRWYFSFVPWLFKKL
jgi:ABC-type transport system substrate-binding protein